MTEQLTWLFTVLSVVTMVAVIGFVFLSNQVQFGIQTNAKLRATELVTQINVLQSSEDGASSQFFMPRSQCIISVYPSFVNMSLGEGSAQQSSVFTLIKTHVEIEPFHAECDGKDLLIVLKKSNNKITLSGGVK